MSRVAALLALLLAAALPARAQDIEPRAYSNAPIGVSFLVAGFAHATGGYEADPTLPLEDANIDTNTAILAWAHVFDVAGRSGKLDVVVPYADLSGDATFDGDPVSRDVTGLADPRVRFSLNLYGAPALSLAELASWQQRTIVGASVQLGLPLGQYDEERLLNIGNNRELVKLELGVSHVVGRWTFELAAPVTLFADNDEFFGGRTREQDPVYALQGGVVLSLQQGMWLALNGTWYTGGRTTVDGIEKDDRLDNSRLGLTFAMPVNRRNSLKLYASRGISTRFGTDFDIIGVAWQYRYGAGL